MSERDTETPETLPEQHLMVNSSSDLRTERRNLFVVDYEVIKRESNRRLIYECRCDRRLEEFLLFISRGKGRPKENEDRWVSV